MLSTSNGKVVETLKEFTCRLRSNSASLNIPNELVTELLHGEQEGAVDKVLECLFRLSALFDDGGKWVWLLDTCTQGIAIAQKAADEVAEAEFLSCWGLARIMQRAGHVEEGLQACRQGLELAQRVSSTKSARVQGLAHHFLAIGLSMNLEKFVVAMKHFRCAIALFQDLQDQKEEARLYFSQAWTMRSFGDFDQALDLVTRALSLWLDCSDPFRATCLGFKADLERMGGQLLQAEKCYQECANICRAQEDIYHLSAALASLGKVCVKQKKLKEAASYLEEALHMAQQGLRRSSGLADVMRSLAALACLRSEKESMQYWYEEALKLATAEEASRPGKGQMQAVLRDMGLAYEQLGDSDAALMKLNEAVEVFEKAWSKQNDDNLRYNFREIEPAKDLGPALQRMLLTQGLPLQALAKAESFRARALSARLMERNGKQFQALPDNSAEISQWLQRTISKHGAAVLYFSMTNPDAHDLFPSSNSQLCTWVLGPDGNLRDWRLQDLGEVLPADQNLDVFVRYARGCVDASRGDEEDKRGSEQWVQDTFNTKLSQGLQGDDRYERGGPRAWRQDRKALTDCYNLLIAPVHQHIKDESHLIIVPDGPLWMVPFAVLMAPTGNCLIQDFAVQLVPSLTVLAEAQELLMSEPGSTDKALVVSHPEVDDSVKMLFPETSAPLPESELEGEMVAKQCIAQGMEVEHLVGNAAGKCTTLSSLQEATTLVHFATHGILQKTGGALALSGADGLMNSQDLQGLELKARAVILSSCNTGRGKLNAEGVVGLPRTFMAAGVPCVVMTLWKVGDRATRHVMEAFYREWFEGGRDTAAALRAAMLEVASKPGAEFHLEHWAAFALVGCSYRVKDVMTREAMMSSWRSRAEVWQIGAWTRRFQETHAVNSWMTFLWGCQSVMQQICR